MLTNKHMTEPQLEPIQTTGIDKAKFALEIWNAVYEQALRMREMYGDKLPFTFFDQDATDDSKMATAYYQGVNDCLDLIDKTFIHVPYRRNDNKTK